VKIDVFDWRARAKQMHRRAQKAEALAYREARRADRMARQLRLLTKTRTSPISE
jgi:hypothetical protein